MENKFIELCKIGNLYKIKKFYYKHKEINISAEDDEVFKNACSKGHLKVAQWLLSISNNKININSLNDLAFRLACINGKIEVAQWLLSIPNNKININVNNDQVFRYANANLDFKILQWLIKIKYNKDIEIEELKNKSYKKIQRMIIPYYEIKETEEFCNICYNNTCNYELITCKHQYCKECLEKISKCAYCRREII